MTSASMSEDRKDVRAAGDVLGARGAGGKAVGRPEKEIRQKGAADASVSPEEGTAQGGVRLGSSRKQWRDRQIEVCFGMISEGRLSALNDLYEVVGADLFGYIRTVVGSRDEAEDVFQEVFARLAEQKRKLARVRKPLAYLFAIGRNEAFKHLKKQARRQESTGPDFLFDEIAARAEREPTISPREAQTALDALPQEQREVVMLKIYEGFTFAEIGELTGVSGNTAASRYRYAMGKLAEKLRRYRGSEQ